MRAAASIQLAKPDYSSVRSIFETLLFSAGLAIPCVSVPQSPHGVPTVLQSDTGWWEC